MRIASVAIENFRAIDNETVFFDDYTCLVGPNGCGKSTILTALNVFFRETENASTDLVALTCEDFHYERTRTPITITVTFDDLSTDEEEDLKDYVRQGKLIVSAVAQWDEASKRAEVKQKGQRLGIQEFRKYFELDKSKSLVGPLQACYEELRQQFNDLPALKVKQQMHDALRAYESAHPDDCEPLPSDDQFYGFHGLGKLEKHVQWVYIPAVKDATSEQVESKNSAIGKLLARRVHSQLAIDGRVDALKQEASRQYKSILDENEEGLRRLSESLNKRFHEWAHDHADLELQWRDQEESVQISKPTAEVKAIEGFKGDIARFGHGLQRSFIFTLLQELSEHKNTGPRLILSCEEPELYQHPPQARHLASVLQKLSTQNAQVFLCTHSPYFVSGRTFENVRVASKEAGRVSVRQATIDNVSNAISAATGKPAAKPGGMAAKIEQELERPLRELFFASFRVFVEGIEDVAYISSYLSLLNLWDRFRGLGGHIVRVDGKVIS
jgi:predicted ATP-dependent endonuclease of OLD family